MTYTYDTPNLNFLALIIAAICVFIQTERQIFSYTLLNPLVEDIKRSCYWKLDFLPKFLKRQPHNLSLFNPFQPLPIILSTFSLKLHKPKNLKRCQVRFFAEQRLNLLSIIQLNLMSCSIYEHVYSSHLWIKRLEIKMWYAVAKCLPIEKWSEYKNLRLESPLLNAS